MADAHAALAYAKELYATEMEWHRAYEEKVLRYQTLSGAVLGAGALSFANIRFAVEHPIATPITMAFLTGVLLTGSAALWGILVSLRAMSAVIIHRPPATKEILEKLEGGTRDEIMKLAGGFVAAADEIRTFNVARGHLIEQAWRAAMVSIAGAVYCLLIALFMPGPPKP